MITIRCRVPFLVGVLHYSMHTLMYSQEITVTMWSYMVSPSQSLMVKSAARFGAPKPSYGHFSHPAGHGRGKFSSRETPKMAINRDFPGLRAFSANVARDKIEEHEIPHPMVKSLRVFRGRGVQQLTPTHPGAPFLTHDLAWGKSNLNERPLVDPPV